MRFTSGTLRRGNGARRRRTRQERLDQARAEEEEVAARLRTMQGSKSYILPPDPYPTISISTCDTCGPMRVDAPSPRHQSSSFQPRALENSTKERKSVDPQPPPPPRNPDPQPQLGAWRRRASRSQRLRCRATWNAISQSGPNYGLDLTQFGGKCL